MKTKIRPAINYSYILKYDTFIKEIEGFINKVENGETEVINIHGSDERMEEDVYDPQYTDIGCELRYTPDYDWDHIDVPYLTIGNDYDDDPIDFIIELDENRMFKPDGYRYIYDKYVEGMKKIIDIQREATGDMNLTDYIAKNLEKEDAPKEDTSFFM